MSCPEYSIQILATKFKLINLTDQKQYSYEKSSYNRIINPWIDFPEL